MHYRSARQWRGIPAIAIEIPGRAFGAIAIGNVAVGGVVVGGFHVVGALRLT